MPNVLITGGSGFLGSYFVRDIQKKDWELTTVGRRMIEKTDHVICDISSDVPKLNQSKYDLVIHCAGKAHSVPKTDQQAKEFIDTNIAGTKNIMKALEGARVESFVFISSIAVYGLSTGVDIDELHPLIAKDPYGQSKITAEKLLQDWSINRNINLLIVRLPLIAGKNPPGNLGKLAQSIKRNRYVRIGNGSARKSMVLAQDVSDLIVKLDIKSGIYNLTDGHHPSFFELESKFEKIYNRKIYSVPSPAMKLLSRVGQLINNILGKSIIPLNDNTYNKITKDLTFSDRRAREKLGWKPNEVLDKLETMFL